MSFQTNIVEVPAVVVTKMRVAAEDQVLKHSGQVGIYGHNDPDPTITGYMGEYAVRQLYLTGGVDCHQNINNDKMPDLSIFPHTSYDKCHCPISTKCHTKREEEVKSWKAGYSWEQFGKTVRVEHAEKYAAKQRDRVWFCEVNRETNCVIVHGWASTTDILQADIRNTPAANHQLEVLRRVSEIMPWIDDKETGWF